MKKYLLIDEEKDFFDSYEECADYATLKKIWQAKEANATGLRLTSSKLKDLLPLAECTNLKRLFINKARVKDLSPLEDLVNLQILEINSSLITDISPLKDLINLKELSIAFTKVEDLTPLTNLTNLKILDASRSQVKDLSPLRKLTKLRILKLALTKVENIDILESLKDLEEIYLSSTLIQDISPLKALNNLKTVSISSTLITDLSPLQNLHLTRIIATSINGINLKPLESLIRKNLPIKWSTLGNTDGIFVENSTFSNLPMEIVKLGNEAILRYWHELNTKEVQLNNQTKLIFVGNTRAGKTSVWKFLKDKIYQGEGDSTHGIKTEIWDTERLGTEYYQNLAVHIWDFGGQEYYHATHRLFLADNAVYVLVWEKDTNKQGTRLEKFKLDDDPNSEIEEVELEHFSASYWLENIEYFAGKHCPILIVQNKVDEEALKANYTEGVQEVNDCFHLSIQSAFSFQEGNATLKRHDLKFQDFKERLLELLRKNATAFKLVKYYAQVREALEAKAKDTEYIAVSELKDIALQFDETPDLENLLAYLKSFTNTVLYFPQNEVLKDRLYLNPTHISRDIYKILNKTVRENNGKFDVVHIQTRLNCDVSEAERFVALMKEFDLIFEKSKTIKGETKQQFITPQYLPKKEDLSEDMQFLIEGYSFETAFTIQFKSFVPRSLMLRFIANNGALSNQETYWHNGIIYKSTTTPSMIKVEYDHDQSTFTIQIQNKQKQTIDMQNIIEQFVKLENSDEHIKISNDGKLYVDLKTIRKLQHENRRDNIFIEGNVVSLDEYDWLIKKQKTNDMMTLKELRNQVQNLISKAKIKEAMEEIATWAHEQNQEQLKSDVSLLKGDWADLSREKTLGLLSNSEANIRQNQLANKILNLVNSYEQKGSSESKEDESMNEFDLNELDIRVIKAIGSFGYKPQDRLVMEKSGLTYKEFQDSLAKLKRQDIAMIHSDGNQRKIETLSSFTKAFNFIENQNDAEDKSTNHHSIKTILFITSSPNNLSVPNVGRQHRAIKEALKDKRKENSYELKIIGFVQPEDLIDEIEEQKPDIIHFFMHNDTEEGLYFENGNGDLIPIEPEDMALLFEEITKNKKVECVVLNACNSYTHIEALSPYVPNIIYTNDFVPDSISEGNNDTISTLFTRKFYEQVFSDKTYTEALTRANTALKFSKMPLSPVNKKKIQDIYLIKTR